MLKYSENKQNIFEVGKEYYLAHCISSDLEMGAGIAVPMKKKFKLTNGIALTGESCSHPTCILCNRVFNLITKKKYHGKPTYITIQTSLEKMRDIVIEQQVKKVAMPKIGCGLDRLQWGRVREIIKDVFGDLDIEVKICYL